jgi:hypothetical protein
MSDTCLRFIEKSRKRIDLIDVDWENDILSDDGKRRRYPQVLFIYFNVIILEIVLPETNILDIQEEEDEEEEVDTDNTWNDLGIDSFLNENAPPVPQNNNTSNIRPVQGLPHVILPQN